MNWNLALPEIVLACCGMTILLVGVLHRRETFLLCSMLTLGAFLLAAMLVVAGRARPRLPAMFTGR